MGQENDGNTRMPNMEGGAYDYHKEDENEDPRERQKRRPQERDQNEHPGEKDEPRDVKDDHTRFKDQPDDSSPSQKP